MNLCSVILRTERGETEPGWQMARPKSETRNRKNLRLIQAMLESLLGRQGEDRRRNLTWVTLEKFSTTLHGDKVNEERGSTKGSLWEPQLYRHQGKKSRNPKAGKGALGHHAQSWLVFPACSPTKTFPPLLSASVWMLNLNDLHLGESSDVGQLGLLRDEFPWSCQDPGWHMEIQHTTQTSVKTSVMNVCWTHQHCLCLGCSRSNKQSLKCQELWWNDYYNHFLGYKTVKLKSVSSESRFYF